MKFKDFNGALTQEIWDKYGQAIRPSTVMQQPYPDINDLLRVAPVTILSQYSDKSGSKPPHSPHYSPVRFDRVDMTGAGDTN